MLEVLHALVEQGNTVVVIEHNLDVIKTADWVLDLGPGGGVNGGEIVAEGTPEKVAAEPRSFTGQYLAPLLARQPRRHRRRRRSASRRKPRRAKAAVDGERSDERRNQRAYFGGASTAQAMRSPLSPLGSVL